jgi:mono/diheme cytochrome c family protein
MVSGSTDLPAPRQSATGGEVLYLRYCASCHGIAGRGDGPVAL